MQDFNLRPEIMGFGRPERLLKAEAAPAPVAPADQWSRRGDFEVNGLGQLRTVLALPASEFEIAASMRHADAPPIPRPVINKGSEPRTIVGSAIFAHDPKTCMCDGCTIERMNRWAPQSGEDRRPLIDQLKARHPELSEGAQAARGGASIAGGNRLLPTIW